MPKKEELNRVADALANLSPAARRVFQFVYDHPELSYAARRNCGYQPSASNRPYARCETSARRADRRGTMSVDHPPPQDFALYVMAALESQDSQRLEDHVRMCPPCAAVLAEEARLETKLQELLPHVHSRNAASTPLPNLPIPVVSAPPSCRPLIASTLLLVAAAFSIVFGIGHIPKPPRAAKDLPEPLPSSAMDSPAPPVRAAARDPQRDSPPSLCPDQAEASGSSCYTKEACSPSLIMMN
jgi:hypothetical protein